MIVAFPAGGPTDVIGRIVAERMRASLGQPIVIENLGGAGGSIGTGRVARARPDGYTINIGVMSTQVLNDALYSLQYDVLNDFAPIVPLVMSPFILFARKSLPGTNLNELIAWLKTKRNMASAGVDVASARLITEFFQKESGTQLTLVPYRGTAPAMQDLVAGQIDLAISDPIAALPQVRADTIKAYGVTTKTRLVSAPDIPTLDEAGLPGFDISLWHGLWAPKGTPKDITVKLNAAVMDALATPTVRARLADLGQETFPPDQQTPEALRAFQKAEIEKWWPIIKAAGIKAE